MIKATIIITITMSIIISMFGNDIKNTMAGTINHHIEQIEKVTK